MTKRDYEAIALEIYNNRQIIAGYNKELADAYDNMSRWIAQDLASLFKFNNPRFKRNKFLAACGVVEDV